MNYQTSEGVMGTGFDMNTDHSIFSSQTVSSNNIHPQPIHQQHHSAVISSMMAAMYHQVILLKNIKYFYMSNLHTVKIY